MTGLEHHYTIQEIAERWNIGYEKVRQIFDVEDGVLRIGEATRLSARRKYKRRYFTLRVPESVLLRVEARLMNKRPPAQSGGLNSQRRLEAT